MLTGAFDLLRVTLAFLVVFAAVPRMAGKNGQEALVRACLLAAMASLLLGSAGLCLPGITAAAYGVFLLTVSGLVRRLGDLRRLLQRLLEFVEQPKSTWLRLRSGMNWRPAIPAEFRAVGLVVVLVALAASAYPLQHMRFLDNEAYARALSLQKLTLGQPWRPDGSVAFLAPVVFLSGCDGATVVRFAGPLMAAGLALAAFAAVFRLARSVPAGLSGAALAAGCAAFADAGHWQAAIFWLLAVLLWKVSRLDALGAAALALLVDPIPGRGVILCAALPLGIALLARTGRVGWRLVEALRVPATLGAAACLIVVPLRQAGKDGPSQYEAAARAVTRLAREFPQNTWLVISPAQELAFTYGHGWHMQLSKFVSKYSPGEVMRPEFRFGFPVATTFVFVEKQPLASRAMASGLLALGPRFDPAMAPYQLRLSRASLQFQAGRLLAAYRTHHPEVEVYLEDRNLVVYRIPG